MNKMSVADHISSWLQTYGGDNLSVAEFLCDRHATHTDKVALCYESDKGESRKVTFAELKELSSRMAQFLLTLGVRKGDRVAVMLPKTVEIIISSLAIWRLGAVYQPLFTAFGPDAIAYRVKNSAAKLIITDTSNRSKLENISARADINIITVADGDTPLSAQDYNFWRELDGSSPRSEVTTVSGLDPLVLLYTSGTTGNPKGAIIPVKSLASFEAYMRFGLDVREEDVYWNVADPGWAYGLYYNLIGPLLIGKATLFYNAPFKPDHAYQIMDKYGVTNFAAAPTAYRVMQAAGDERLRRASIQLRVASSAGEPLNPSLINWAKEQMGVSIYDHFGQTELGMAVNNHHRPELQQIIKPGSMGQSMPGLRTVVLDQEANELGPGEEGELAVDIPNSPLFWFQGYWQDEAQSKQRFVAAGRYYLTGDSVSTDEDGYHFFSGRSDDVILSAGYRIGPFEVESALLLHPAVAETAVVGKHDELKGEIVKAFVVLKAGHAPSEQLSTELSRFVKTRLSAHQYPRVVSFVKELPKTPSGKIQRYLLRNIN
jgi:acetyl-CoA synthetase